MTNYQNKSKEELIFELKKLKTEINSLKASCMNPEHKLAELELKESEKRFRSYIDFAPHGVFVTDKNGNYVEVNSAACNITGYSKEELLSMNLIDLIPPDSIEIARSHFNKVVNEGISSGETQFLRKDGTKEFWTIDAVKLSEDRFLGYVVNITERKLTETELLVAKEAADTNSANVSAIIEGTTDSIWAFNRNYEILYINQAFRNEFYQSFGVWLDQGVSLIGSLPEALRPIWKPRYDRALNNEYFTLEEAIETANGKVFIQVSFNPIVKKGQVIGGSCFGSNITNRKLTELELIKAKEQAEESDHLKSAFLANMSHEIRTPMNGILGFAEILKEPNLTGEQQQEYIGIIERSGARMLNIINDIIDISKIEAGQMKVEIKESNIDQQIEYIYTFFKPEVEAKGMKLIKKNLPSKETILFTDREKLYAILTNLVKNAIKYTNKGSIEFGYNLVQTLHARPQLEFYVKDTGVGIPKDRQKVIFDRFIQADISDTMARQGAGLGLAITKSYVTMLGGNIWVESEEGIGSTFYFTLPYNSELEVKTKDKNPLSAQDSENDIQTLKILIAEDDEISEKLITIIVNAFCKEILKVHSGLEAIEVSRTNPDIDLILMDNQMPEMDGYEATRQIRQFNKAVIIISQTAYGLTGDKEKAIEAGCNDFISKPINKAELLALIRRYFNK